MSKRFTDTTIWDRPWFKKLLPEEKCAIRFILDKCDAVGVWIPDFEGGDYHIGAKVNWSALPTKVNGNIEILDNGKWFLVDFCDFQYGELSEACKPHKSYMELLKKHRLLKGYPKGIHTLQEKEKEKELEKDNILERKIDEVLSYFRDKTGSKVSLKTAALRSKVSGRLAEGYSVDDCKKAIAYVYASKKDNPDQRMYIRIDTIFAPTKFAGYLDAWHREMGDGR